MNATILTDAGSGQAIWTHETSWIPAKLEAEKITEKKKNKSKLIAKVLALETKIGMNPEEHAAVAGPSELPYFLIKELPVDLIVYLGNFMQFKDYSNFIRGLWPDHNEDEVIQLALWKKSTHRLRAEFIDGKHLEIEYNYDHTRIDGEQVLINVNTLLPVFGGLVPPDTETFADVKRLTAFVETYVRLNECHAYQYASCPCHLDIEAEAAGEFESLPENGCAKGHFHHFCSQHVNHWLSFVLENSIKSLEEGSFDEESSSDLADLLGNSVYFQDGRPLYRPNPSFSFRLE